MSSSPLTSLSRTPAQDASLVGTILMPYFLSKPSTEAITTEAQSVRGMKPIFTSSFSGLSEPCAQTAVRSPGSRPEVPTAAAPWIRVRRLRSIFGEESVFHCGLAMADGMTGDLEPHARAVAMSMEMRGTGAARKRDRLVQEAPRGETRSERTCRRWQEAIRERPS